MAVEEVQAVTRRRVIPVIAVTAQSQSLTVDENEEDAAPAIRPVNAVIDRARTEGASDIHMDTSRNIARREISLNFTGDSVVFLSIRLRTVKALSNRSASAGAEAENKPQTCRAAAGLRFVFCKGHLKRHFGCLQGGRPTKTASK